MWLINGEGDATWYPYYYFDETLALFPDLFYVVYRLQLELVQRCALRPQKPVVVRQEDAFVMLMPEETMRLTVGIDHKEHEVIGKQWKSWCIFEDHHYRFEVAGARQYYESPEEVGVCRSTVYLTPPRHCGISLSLIYMATWSLYSLVQR